MDDLRKKGLANIESTMPSRGELRARDERNSSYVLLKAAEFSTRLAVKAYEDYCAGAVQVPQWKNECNRGWAHGWAHDFAASVHK